MRSSATRSRSICTPSRRSSGLPWGGSVAPDHEGGKGRPQLVQLRLPRDLVQRIDMARKHRIVAPSRHAWLLEALLEKLETEEHQKVP